MQLKVQSVWKYTCVFRKCSSHFTHSIDTCSYRWLRTVEPKGDHLLSHFCKDCHYILYRILLFSSRIGGIMRVCMFFRWTTMNCTCNDEASVVKLKKKKKIRQSHKRDLKRTALCQILTNKLYCGVSAALMNFKSLVPLLVVWVTAYQTVMCVRCLFLCCINFLTFYSLYIQESLLSTNLIYVDTFLHLFVDSNWFHWACLLFFIQRSSC